jgi:DNA-binding NarL/FixJ family response regulator
MKSAIRGYGDMRRKTADSRSVPVRLAVLAATQMGAHGVAAFFHSNRAIEIAGVCTWKTCKNTAAHLEKLNADILYVLDFPGSASPPGLLNALTGYGIAAPVIVQLSTRDDGNESQYLSCRLVRGLLYPDDDAGQLEKACRMIMRGQRWIRRGVYDRFLAAGAGCGRTALTSRERQIARQASLGRTNREIGQKLFISEATVKLHLNRVYRKLGVKNRTQLSRLHL